jgi:hypothetical protein
MTIRTGINLIVLTVFLVLAAVWGVGASDSPTIGNGT